jgi:hypothetical protein
MYEIPTESYTTAENNFLPLLYAVLALGKLFSQGDREMDKSNYDTAVDEG